MKNSRILFLLFSLYILVNASCTINIERPSVEKDSSNVDSIVKQDTTKTPMDSIKSN